MQKQVRNIAGAYVLVMVLVILLLLAITIRLVDVYYDQDMKSILEKRVYQLETLFTNYTDASLKLEDLNDEYIDTVLYTRLEGILDLTCGSLSSTPDILKDYKSLFNEMPGHEINIVSVLDYENFMREKYELEVDGIKTYNKYFSSIRDDERWRLLTRYLEEKDAVIIVAEEISSVDEIQEQFIEDIESRIEEHMDREPLAVSLIMVTADNKVQYCSEHNGNHSSLDGIDLRSGKPLIDLIHNTKDGYFEYEIKTEEGYKEYFAVVRDSSEYEAFIVLSMQRKSFTDRLGKTASLFLKLLLLIIVILCIWTVKRFSFILGNDFKNGSSARTLDEKSRNSVF